MSVSHAIQPSVSKSPSPPRAPRTERTRRRLLDAGRTLFAEHGPREVTSHSIAAEAGFASGTFYLHFKDKLELFRELAEEAAAQLDARLQSVSQGKTDPTEIMQAQAEALVGFAEDQRELLRIVFHPGGEAGDIGSRILHRMAESIRTRRREAEVHGLIVACFDEDVLARAIVGMWAHVLAWWAEDPTRSSRDAIVQTLTHFHLHGSLLQNGSPCGVPGALPTQANTPNTPTSPPEGDSPR
jgi:AcrR family transcriptional regulator